MEAALKFVERCSQKPIKPHYTIKASALHYATNANDYPEQQYIANTLAIFVQGEGEYKSFLGPVVATVEEEFDPFCRDLERIFNLQYTVQSLTLKWHTSETCHLDDVTLTADNLSATLRLLKTRNEMDKLLFKCSTERVKVPKVKESKEVGKDDGEE